MTLKQASMIIGKHFQEISDKLLNTLQLQEQSGQSNDNELLIATIQQRTEKLSRVPFVEAVNFRENKKYLKWTIFPVGALVLLLILSPAFISKPAARILDYTTVYEKPLPFDVHFLNPLEVIQNEDYELIISLKGDEFPENFFVETNGMKMQMDRKQTNQFSVVFKKVSQDIDFKVQGGPYQSSRMLLKVFPKAMLTSFEAKATYPSYTKRSPEFFRDQNWISIPEGTILEWSFYTRAADSFFIFAQDTVKMEAERNENVWNFTSNATHSGTLEFKVSNNKSGESTPMPIYLEVVKDDYPLIFVQPIEDELLSKNKYFTGIIGDDYGFSKLTRQISILDRNGKSIKEVSDNIEIEKDVLRQQFYHQLNLDEWAMENGHQILVQFAVFDNDQVNGQKMSLSAPFNFSFVSEEMLDSIARAQDQAINNQLQKALTEAKEVKRELSEINRDLLNKKELDWNDKQRVNDLLKKQQSLEDLMDQIMNDQQNLNQFNNENKTINEALLQKQEQIEKLIEEIIPEDIRKMMQELQQLLDELNKDQVADMLKQMEMNSEKMEQMLDRNLELLKQLQVEKEMNDLIERLDQLAEELRKNADKTAEKLDNIEQLSEQLDGVQEEFSREMDKLNQLKENNAALERPFQLDNTQQEEQEILEDIESGKEQLRKRDNNRSAKSQQNASEKMKQMAEKLKMGMQMGNMQQMAEDAAALRFLLENILRISVSQENTMLRLGQIRRDDPAYIDIMKDQNIVSESFRVVEDSLVSLSRRQPMIQNFVFNEVAAVKSRVGESQDFMKDRQSANASNAQQYAMMALNNLALMLSEALKNMQESMGMPSPMQGEGQGKAGQSVGKSLQNMREMQEALGQQLKNAMEGKSGKNGKSGMSEDVARMAAQQEAIRKQMKDIMEQLKGEGDPNGGGLNEVLESMEQFEEQLVNKQLNQQTLQRQNDIVTRLLESEKALKEREKEERRESNEFKGKEFGNLIDELEYKRKVEKQQDFLRTTPADFQPFYKQKVNRYYLRFNALNSYEKGNYR